MPAACIAGRLLARRGDLRKAARIVETAWKANPHPDLAKVYLGLRTGDSVRDRLARAETLAKLSSWDPEARLAVAQAALDAREFGQARDALKPLLADRPTVRTCLLMARIEEAEHGANSGRAREWLARAAHAPRDPLWIADGFASETWAPISPVSGRLDAFEWREPPNTLAGPSEVAEADAGEASKGAAIEGPAVLAAAKAPAGAIPAGAGPAGASPASVGAANPVVLPVPGAGQDGPIEDKARRIA